MENKQKNFNYAYVIYILAFLMIFTSFSMFAQWNISKVSEELYEGSREDGKVVTIFSNTSISTETLEKVQNCLDIVWNIPGIQGTKASVNVDSDNNFHFIIYLFIFFYIYFLCIQFAFS